MRIGARLGVEALALEVFVGRCLVAVGVGGGPVLVVAVDVGFTMFVEAFIVVIVGPVVAEAAVAPVVVVIPVDDRLNATATATATALRSPWHARGWCGLLVAVRSGRA